ncbi:FG-GAP-like repeat-containing protein [Nannocystis radixulma]|uniref:FG-GAP-like repeat-containing protein n=1 Tax=Nannocystis radixulma TaxID=2995305 RepID=A0ABT5B8J3_9BACT|nr:FG-GAP-like repeat-containing protein [Nannocystis radixulma]MDC0670444.1 FG-GAP-like repeat-containing protein [Nannocystis radixulma]
MSVVASRSAVVAVLLVGCSYEPTVGGDDVGVELTEGAGSSEADEAGDDTTEDAPKLCEDACEDGAAACAGDGVARCAADEHGCLVWLVPEPCPEGQACSDGACSAAAGFVREAEAWAVPAGGRAGAGFATPSGRAAAVGDDDWELLDLDGDGALDLVRTAAAYPAGDGFVTRTKGFPLGPFWEVHRGGGADGFAAGPMAWSLPVGVGLGGRGLVASVGEPQGDGDLVWAVRDVDGDARPDLVVTGVRAPDESLVPLGPADAPRWDVYRNDGSGFADQAEPWPLPPGADGQFFHHVDGAAAAANGPAWSLLDLDGDGWSDLVITGRSAPPLHVVPGFPDSPHWQLHRGGPGGFESNFALWSLPLGGRAETGFAGLSGSAEAPGDQLWTLLDLDGDGRRELVVTGQLDDAAVGPAALTLDGAPGWAAYPAGDDGFDLSPRTVALPAAGGATGGRGYYAASGGQDIAGTSNGPYDANGWELLDLDGDGRLDLVVTNEAREIAGGVYKRGALGGDAPYWDVYFGTDAGFVAATRWPTPTGGFIGRGFLWAHGVLDPVPENEGTVLWHTGDLDGDARPELVVTGLAAPGEGNDPWNWQVPGLDGKPHWQVHWQSR